MKMRILLLTAAVALAVFAFTGCATERQAQYTATGAGIGAITGGILGGVIGSMSGRTAEGVAIGSILGGAMGASVGNEEYRQERSEESAASYYSYNRQEASRDLLRIEDAEVTPKVAYPGDEVALSATFTVLNRWGASQVVHEVREIRLNGRLIGRPETSTRRPGGTWSSSAPLRLADNAEPGTYVVNTIVETDASGDVRESTFRVEASPRWRR